MNRNTRPNNNQLITYYLRVRYLLRIQQYPVNTTYNKMTKALVLTDSGALMKSFDFPNWYSS